MIEDGEFVATVFMAAQLPTVEGDGPGAREHDDMALLPGWFA